MCDSRDSLIADLFEAEELEQRAARQAALAEACRSAVWVQAWPLPQEVNHGLDSGLRSSAAGLAPRSVD